jgi:hypothetical protein
METAPPEGVPVDFSVVGVLELETDAGWVLF